MLLTRSPLEYPQAGLSVRLACVKHAASVRPEPGSNSPLNAYNHAHHQKRHARSTKKRNAHQKQTPDHKHKHEQTSSKICTTKQMPRHQTPPPPHRQQQSPAPDKIGTDYRYAVEFSKNGHAPIPALRTAWGATFIKLLGPFIKLLGPVRSVKLPVPQCLPAIAGGVDAPRRSPRLEAVAPLTSTRQHQ